MVIVSPCTPLIWDKYIIFSHASSLCWLEVILLLSFLFFLLLFQLTAFGGDLKYTVSYDIPMESVDSDIVSSVDVIIQVDCFQLAITQTLLGIYG